MNLSEKILNSIPIAVVWLILKIIMFPFWLVYKCLRAMWEDVAEFGGELWDEWYSIGSRKR